MLSFCGMLEAAITAKQIKQENAMRMLKCFFPDIR